MDRIYQSGEVPDHSIYLLNPLDLVTYAFRLAFFKKIQV